MSDRTLRCRTTPPRAPGAVTDDVRVGDRRTDEVLDLLELVLTTGPTTDADGTAGGAVDPTVPAVDLRAATPGAPLLVGLADGGPGSVEVAVRSVPPDDRCGGAGLFGIRAVPGTVAVGVRFDGLTDHDGDRAHDHDRTGPAADGSVSVALVLHRDRTLRHRLWDPRDAPRDGSTRGAAADGCVEAPSGVVVDALHRVLGLRCPGPRPSLRQLVDGWWHRDLIGLAVAGRCTARDAVAVHPGAGGLALRVDPSAIDAAGDAVAAGTSWARLRRIVATSDRATSGGGVDLTADEADWMDDTMFARWLVDPLPGPELTAAVLRQQGAGEAAELVDAVAARR